MLPIDLSCFVLGDGYVKHKVLVAKDFPVLHMRW